MISKEQLKNDLKEVLNVFLNINQEKISFNQISWGLLRETLEELGWGKDPEGDFATNGWQYDFWVDFIKNDLRIAISGSLHYTDINILKQY